MTDRYISDPHAREDRPPRDALPGTTAGIVDDGQDRRYPTEVDRPDPKGAVRVHRYEASFDEDEEDDLGPYRWEIGVKDMKTGEVRYEEFAAVRNPGAGEMSILAGLTQVVKTPNGQGRMEDTVVFNFRDVDTFLARVLEDDGYQRLVNLLDDRDVRVDWNGMMQAVRDLSEAYMNRPLESASTSPAWSSGAGRPSRAQRRGRESTSKR